MINITERNKEIKKALVAEYGKAVSVKSGNGTACGWVHIMITANDPCPFKQNKESCRQYCEDTACKGNGSFMTKDSGRSIRLTEDIRICDHVEKLLSGIELNTFIDDEGYCSKNKCLSVDVRFV